MGVRMSGFRSAVHARFLIAADEALDKCADSGTIDGANRAAEATAIAWHVRMHSGQD
jgi:hypothetical protein